MQYVSWGLEVLSAALVGYLAGYAKKKGENRAIREDLNKLLVQVAAVTTTTTEIEATISSGVWDRQKRWELKRDLLFETAKKIAIVQDALAGFCAVALTEKDSIAKGGSGDPERRVSAAAEWNEASKGMEQAALLMHLACSEELRKGLRVFRVRTVQIAGEIFAGRPEAFPAATNEMVAMVDSLRGLMRKEIGLDNDD